MTIQETPGAPPLTYDHRRLSENDSPLPVRRTLSAAARSGGEAWSAPPAVSDGRSSYVPLRTRGEVEAAICVGITRFEQESLGRGPTDIRTHILGDLVMVRLYGVLTLVERRLATSSDPEKGRDLAKQVRTLLFETAKPALQVMIENETGGKVVSLHHDFSTVTGEEVILYTLATEPVFREPKSKAK